MYKPQPIDTDNIQLPEDIVALGELIAKNVHEVWSSGRIAEGWTYGPVRNDAKKETPCLVPYEDLPEVEKEYDRRTAFGTLKTLVALGYRIVKA